MVMTLLCWKWCAALARDDQARPEKNHMQAVGNRSKQRRGGLVVEDQTAR